MAVEASCDCGHRMKVKDSAAGKRIRCPECSGPIDVPENELWGEEEATDYSNDFEDDFDDEPRSRSRGGRSSGRGSRPGISRESGTRTRTRTRTTSRSRSESAGRSEPPNRRKKPSGGGGGMGLGLAIGGGAIVLVGGIVFGVMFLMDGKDAPVGNNLAQGNNGNAVNPVANPAVNNIRPNANQPNAVAPNPVTPNVAPPNTVNNTTPAGKFWAVLSNFKTTNTRGGFNKTYTIDYRVVSGTPANEQFVLYISEADNSPIRSSLVHYLEAKVDMQSSGSVTFQAGPTFGIRGALEANLAIKQGHEKWKPISGKIRVGGGPSSSQVPKGVVQQAGANAQGKEVVLGNTRTEVDIGSTVYLLDFVVQKRPTTGYYFLVIKNASGDGVEFDISSKLRRATVGIEVEFGGKPSLPGRVSGTLTAHVEKRNSPLRSSFRVGRRQTATIVSNQITFQ
jgi:hypothetical protein